MYNTQKLIAMFVQPFFIVAWFYAESDPFTETVWGKGMMLTIVEALNHTASLASCNVYELACEGEPLFNVYVN